MEKEKLLLQLPGKNCGMCGSSSCGVFAEEAATHPKLLSRCIHMEMKTRQSCAGESTIEDIKWLDRLGRDYDFILDQFPDDPGPRETMLPFNPQNLEKLGIKRGDVLYGRPAWMSCGCPVTHVGVVMEEPDFFNGTLEWCIVGPLAGRKSGINIGYYNSTSYDGLVRDTRVILEIGRRYFFQPRRCMLQWRHSGLVNALTRTKDGMRVHIEGLWIG